MTRLSSQNRLRGKRESAVTGPLSKQGNVICGYVYRC